MDKDGDTQQFNVVVEKQTHADAKTTASRLGMKLNSFTEFGLKVWLNIAQDLSIADTAKLAKGEYCLVALVAVKKRLAELGMPETDLEPLDTVYQKASVLVERLTLVEKEEKE